MTQAYTRKAQQIQVKSKQIVKALENDEQLLVQNIKNTQKTVLADCVGRIAALEDSAAVLQELEKLTPKLDEYKKTIEWNKSFIKLLETTNIAHGVSQTTTEDAFEDLKNFVDKIKNLWGHINHWLIAEKMAKETPFTLLKHEEVKVSGKKVLKFLLNSGETFTGEYSGIIKALTNRVNTLQTLIEETEFMQKFQLLPEEGLAKIMEILKTHNKRFTVFDIDVASVKNNRYELEQVYERYKEVIRINAEMQQIKAEIETAELVVRPLENGVWILAEYEAIFELLENNAMRIEFVLARVERDKEGERISKVISDMKETAEQLVMIQDRYIQMKRLFECTSVRLALDKLYKSFQVEEKAFCLLMDTIRRTPNAYKSLCSPELPMQTKGLDSELQRIQKRLEDMFETKKTQAPRLLFLSNTQLVEFFKGVQDLSFNHISLLFPGIKTLLVSNQNPPFILPPDLTYANPTAKHNNVLKLLKEEKGEILHRDHPAALQTREIIGFAGDEAELIKIATPIPLPDTFGENVEWISQLESQMQKSMGKAIAQAINSFTKSALEEWVLDFPLQATLTATHMIITHEICELLQPETEADFEEQSMEADITSTRYGPKPPQEIKQDPKDRKELLEMFGNFIYDQHFPINLELWEILKATKESSIKGLRLRLMLWLVLLAKNATGSKSYPFSTHHLKMLEATITLINYMKDVVDDLDMQKVTKQSDYNWKKHVRISWSPEEQACKVDIGAFSLPQRNEYLGSCPRHCLLYPMAEKVFVNITSSLREKSGIITKSYSGLDQGTEVFEEFAAICATPLHLFKCYNTTTLKHALQMVNAAALAGVWLLFENLEKLEPLTLTTLSKEIQMVQQQFIIADLVSPEQDELDKEDEEEDQDAALIEHSKSSLQIKRKKFDSKQEIDAGQKIGSVNNKTTFGVFATVQCEALERIGGDRVLEGLKGAFRITSIIFADLVMHMEVLLRGKRFGHAKEIAKGLLEFYAKIEKYTGYSKPPFRIVHTIIEIAERIRDCVIKENEDLGQVKNKKIAEMKTIEELYDFDSIEGTHAPQLAIEMEALGKAVYMYEKGHPPHNLPTSNWDSILTKNLQECKMGVKDFNLYSMPSQANTKGKQKVELSKLLKETIEGLKLIPTESMVNKVLEIYQVSLTRTHICLTGPSGSGKSTLISVFCSFLYRLHGKIVKKYVVNPIAESKGLLYGEWRKDICILKGLEQEIKEQPNNSIPCILCDSDLDQIWLELFSSFPIMLPECTLELPRNTLFMYECVEMSKVSPKSATMMSVLSLKENFLGYKEIVKATAISIYEESTETTKNVFIDKVAFASVIIPIYDFVFGFFQSVENLKYFFAQKKNYRWSTKSGLKISLKLLKTFTSVFNKQPIKADGNSRYISSHIKKIVESFTLIAIVWGFGHSLTNPKDESEFTKAIREQIEKMQLRYDMTLDKNSLYDLWVDTEKAKFCTIPFLTSHLSPILKTKQFLRAEFLADLLLPQNEALSIMGPSGSGKSTLATHLRNFNESKVAAGSVYCSPILDTVTLKKYVDNFYTVKKKHVATPLTWKPVVFFISDLHMSYPSNVQLIEFLRYWTDCKGYYDVATCRFKSVANFSLVYTAEESIVQSSSHLRRLLNGSVKFVLSEVDEIQQTLFVQHWINTIEGEVKKGVKDTVLDIVKQHKPSLKALHNACTSLSQLMVKVDTKHAGNAIYSELLYELHDRIAKEEQKEDVLKLIKETVTKSFPNLSPATILGNYHERNKELSYIEFPINKVKSKLQNLWEDCSLPWQQYLCFDDAIKLLWKIFRLLNRQSGHGIFVLPQENPNEFKNLLAIAAGIYKAKLVQPDTRSISDFEAMKRLLQDSIIDCITTGTKTLFYLNINFSTELHLVEPLNLFITEQAEEVLLMTSEFKKSLSGAKMENFHVFISMSGRAGFNKLNMNFPRLVESAYLLMVPESGPTINTACCLEEAIIHTLPTDILVASTKAAYKTISESLEQFSDVLQFKERYFSFLEATIKFHEQILQIVKYKSETLESLQTAFELFTERFEFLKNQQRILSAELEKAEQDITLKKEEIAENNKKFAHIDMSMEERRKICTDHDNAFRIKKEYIDAVLEKYDKEFNKKLQEFRHIPSHEYLENLQDLPLTAIDTVQNMLKAFGFRLGKSIINNQTELGRVLEGTITTDFPLHIKSTLENYVAKTKGETAPLPRILRELFAIILNKKYKKEAMENEYKELEMLQKLTAEDQYYLISSKKDKDIVAEIRAQFEKELNARISHRNDIASKKINVDQLCGAAESIHKYMEEKAIKIKEELQKMSVLKDSALVYSILLSATVNYLSALPMAERDVIRKNIRDKLHKMGCSIYKHTVDFIEVLLILLKEKDVSPARIKTKAYDAGIPMELLVETFFVVRYATRPLVLLDPHGAVSQIIKVWLAETESVYKVSAGKVLTHTMLGYKLTPGASVFLYDAISDGLCYDAELLLEQLVQQNTPHLQTRVIVVQQNSNKKKASWAASKGMNLVNCEAEGGEKGERINEVLYRNILPDMHEKWVDCANKWKEEIVERENGDKEIARLLTSLTKTEDYTLELMNGIKESIGGEASPEELYKEYKEITAQHPLLTSYSHALAILFDSLKKYGEITGETTMSWRMFLITADQVLAKYIRDLNYRESNEDDPENSNENSAEIKILEDNDLSHKESALNEGVINKDKQKEEKKRTDLVGNPSKEESRVFTIDEEFFSNEILPLIFGVVTSSIPPDSACLLVLIYAFKVALKKKTIRPEEFELFFKHFFKLPGICLWTEFDKDFVPNTELAEVEHLNPLLQELAKVYPSELAELEKVEILPGKTQGEVKDSISSLFAEVNLDTLIKKINVQLIFRGTELKSLLNKFVHVELNDIVDFSYESMKFHKFIKTASWPLPIMVHTSESLNIVNIICSIASFYGVGLEVLRTDDDLSLDKAQVETQFLTAKRYWPFTCIKGKIRPRDLLETDDKRQTFTVQSSLDLIKECAIQGNWVLVSTTKIISYWDKVCDILEDLYRQGKTAHSFRLFVDWQFMSKQDLPESMMVGKAFVFYLNEANADDMEGYNDIWAHILNSNILKVSANNSKRLRIDTTEQKTIVLSGVSSQLSSCKNATQEKGGLKGEGIVSANLSAISCKSYNDDTVIHSGNNPIINL